MKGTKRVRLEMREKLEEVEMNQKAGAEDDNQMSELTICQKGRKAIGAALFGLMDMKPSLELLESGLGGMTVSLNLREINIMQVCSCF